jgi:ParB family chromosome partitioning protein
MQIEMKNVSEIKPYWRNPRTNTATIEPLKESIKQFGFNQPILIDANDVVIAGHARLKAATQLGMNEVPVIVLDVAPEQAKAYRIADNKVGESTKWDMEKLIPELREIEEIDVMQVYFPDIDIEQLLKETAGASKFDEATEEDVQDAEREAQDRFSETYNEASGAIIDTTCPHCGKTFGIDRRLI